MLKRLLWPVLCSVILVAKVPAQEVIVAREKKSARSPEPAPSEQAASESPTAAPHKSKAHQKKSAPASLTLEEMRAAGARAAGGGNDQSASPPNKTREPDAQSGPAPNPTFAETPRPVKRETPAEQKSRSRSSRSRATNVDDLGPIRPTLLESGREGPSPSPPGR